MVEQRPFKALVLGSSPSQPNSSEMHFYEGKSGCLTRSPISHERERKRKKRRSIRQLIGNSRKRDGLIASWAVPLALTRRRFSRSADRRGAVPEGEEFQGAVAQHH